MIKVSLIGAYGYKNYGDDLLAWIFSDYLNEWFPDLDLTVSSPQEGMEYTMDITGADRALPLTSPKYWLQRESKKNPKSDIVIFGGGGILYDYPNLRRFNKIDPRRASSLFYLISLHVAKRNGGVFSHGIGIGPLQSKYSQLLTSLFINKHNFLTVRDNTSKEYIVKFGAQADVVPDPSFILANSAKKNISKKKKIGIVLREWDESGIFQDEETLEQLFLEIENKTGFTAVPITLKANEYRSVGNREALEWNPDKMGPIEFAEKLAEFSLLITMRLHAMNVGACYGVPSIAIGIDPKITKSAYQLGMGDYICSPNSSISEIVEKTIKLNNDNKIRNSLQNITIEYSREVAESFKVLKKEIDKISSTHTIS